MVTQQYFFNGIERFQWIFDTPNQLAAFVVTLIPFVWACEDITRTQLDGKKLRLFISYAAEGLLFYALFRTMSRGGSLAYIAGLTIYWLLRPSRSIAWIGLRVAILSLAGVATQLGSRFSVDYISSDPSVLNRLAHWKGSVEMMAIRPCGWGAGRSGYDYMDLFQQGGSEIFFSPVNSYFYVGVEYGISTLALVFFVFGWIAIAAIKFGASYRESTRNLVALARGAAATWMAWIIACVFSTLIIVPSLWVLPIISACSMLFVMKRSRFEIGKHWWQTAVVTAAISASIFFCGTALRGANPVAIEYADSAVSIGWRAGLGKEQIDQFLVYSDISIIGRYPGKLWREAVISNPRLKFRTPADTFSVVIPTANEGIVLIGRHAEDIRKYSKTNALIIIHPTGCPPDASPKDYAGRLLLPRVDEFGTSLAWRSWAETQNITISYSTKALRGQTLIRSEVSEIAFNQSLRQ